MECWVRGEVWTESGEDASGPYYEAMDGILEVGLWALGCLDSSSGLEVWARGEAVIGTWGLVYME